MTNFARRISALTLGGFSAVVFAQTPQAPKTDAPAYNGSAEYSLSVSSTKWGKVDGGGEGWQPQQVWPTRVMEQLKGFTPTAVPQDKWGGRADQTAKATGFFYVKQINGRWWAIDPEGHPYIHRAVVELAPGTSDNARAALARLYGDQARWMAITQGWLVANGFNGAGAWSRADLIRASPVQAAHPLAYTVNLDVMTGYGRQHGGLHPEAGHTGYPKDTIFAFDPAFETYANETLKRITQYADDPALFGYFSDNEMPIRRSNLEHYLQLPHDDAGYLAAKKWMDDHGKASVDDEARKGFLAFEVDRYASIVSAAIKRYDPHHMYLGARYTGQTEDAPEAFAALGKYADAISVNYYNAWTPDLKRLTTWSEAAGKPIMITEWYTKGADSGMPNHTGAGWLVRTQAERGAFYQNYALELLESKLVVGWHWFKYQDNDPNDPKAELSNKDANKGVVNIGFQPYQPLVDRMRQLNRNVYALADYFDGRAK